MPAGSLDAMLVLRAAPHTSRHWPADCEAGTLHYICQRHHEVWNVKDGVREALAAESSIVARKGV